MIEHGPLERLAELRDPGERDAFAADVVKNLGPPPGLPAATLARIGTRLGPRRPRSIGLRLGQLAAAACVALAAIQGAAIVSHAVARRLEKPPVSAPAPAAALPPRAVPQADPLPAPTRLSLPPVVLAADPAPRARRIVPASGPAPSPAPTTAPPDPIALEAAQLRLGLQQAKDQRYDLAAQTLASYRRDHPEGAFAREAALGELDADLALGRRDEALSLLTGLGDDPALPRRDELHVLRAELLARSGRCAEALPRFQSIAGTFGERASYGAANCLRELGRTSESREAFEAFLGRYPQSSLAGEARRALGQ